MEVEPVPAARPSSRVDVLAALEESESEDEMEGGGSDTRDMSGDARTYEQARIMHTPDPCTLSVHCQHIGTCCGTSGPAGGA